MAGHYLRRSKRSYENQALEADERIMCYFDEALEMISEAMVEHFMNSVNEIQPSINGLELFKFTYDDWRLTQSKRKCVILALKLALMYNQYS